MFHTECYADQHLVKLLMGEKNLVMHHNDKGRVVNKIRKCRAEIGIIDEDPFQVQPSYLKNMVIISEKHDLRLLKDGNENYIIVICPRLEEWLVRGIKKSKKKLTDFFDARNAKELHTLIHHRKPQLEKLVNEMLLLENVYIKTLKCWLNKEF